MSNEAKSAVMDQYVDLLANDVAVQLASGLSHANLSGIASMAASDAGVSLVEQPVYGLLMLRATSDASALSEALHSQCGVALSSCLHSENNDDYCVRWMAPDAWVLSCPLGEAYSIEQSLRATVPGHIAIVNISGGYTVLELSGIRARSVLMKSTVYDVHPDHLVQGKVVNTTFAKAQVTLRAIEVSDTHGCYELMVRRSFSDYLWLWLQRAAAEYGLNTTAATR